MKKIKILFQQKIVYIRAIRK